MTLSQPIPSFLSYSRDFPSLFHCCFRACQDLTYLARIYNKTVHHHYWVFFYFQPQQSIARLCAACLIAVAPTNMDSSSLRARGDECGPLTDAHPKSRQHDGKPVDNGNDTVKTHEDGLIDLTNPSTELSATLVRFNGMHRTSLTLVSTNQNAIDCLFLYLPGELRMQIWTYAVSYGTPSSSPFINHSYPPSPLRCRDQTHLRDLKILPLTMLLISRLQFHLGFGNP